MRTRRVTAGAAMAAAVLAPVSVAPVAALASAGPAAVEAPCPGDPTFGGGPSGDIDGDMVSDVVVGVPTEHSSAGAVDLHPSTAPSMRLTRGMVAGFGPATAGDRFGAAVALGDDVDNDGCPDLAIGAPGERGAGAVHVVLGGPGGVSRAEGLTVRETDPHAGDRFGAAVAMSRHDLWVGAPGRAVAGRSGAGAVFHYEVYRTGTGLAASLLHVLSQASPGIAGAPEAGDHFGAALSANLFRAIIGVPGEDVGGNRDAGLVQTLVGASDFGDRFTSSFTERRAFTQSSTGVPGAPEAGDRFGASVAVAGWAAAVGIPGEDIGRRRDAGAVQLFDAPGPGGTDGHFTVSGLVLQGSGSSERHIPGWPEAGDRFGASVALASGLFGRSEPDDVLAGAPGEDIAGTSDAGSVTVFRRTLYCELCVPQARVAYRGHGLPGPLRAGDAVGTAVGARTTQTSGPGDEMPQYAGAVLAGAPGSPVDGRDDVGELLLPDTAFRPLADPRAGLGYGSVTGRN